MKTEVPKIPEMTAASMSDNDELLSLRAQVAQLRQRLQQSEIVTDKIMRQVMRGKSSWLGALVTSEFIVLPFLTLAFISFLSAINASILPAIVFTILAGISAWMDCYTLNITKKSIYTMPLLQLREFLIKQKKQRIIQLIVEAPLTIAWLLWFGYTIFAAQAADPELKLILNIGFWVGLAIGIPISIIVIAIIYYKAQKTNNELIERIDERQSE